MRPDQPVDVLARDGRLDRQTSRGVPGIGEKGARELNQHVRSPSTRSSKARHRVPEALSQALLEHAESVRGQAASSPGFGPTSGHFDADALRYAARRASGVSRLFSALGIQVAGAGIRAHGGGGRERLRARRIGRGMAALAGEISASGVGRGWPRYHVRFLARGVISWGWCSDPARQAAMADGSHGAHRDAERSVSQSCRRAADVLAESGDTQDRHDLKADGACVPSDKESPRGSSTSYARRQLPGGRPRSSHAIDGLSLERADIACPPRTGARQRRQGRDSGAVPPASLLTFAAERADLR